MTQRAREVLHDCEAALDDLMTGPTGLQWRTRWAAAVALLRTVGHVLDKVDAEENPAVRAVVTAEWERLKNTKPEPVIYWEFIERERNNILKIYRFGARQNVTLRPGSIVLDRATGESVGLPGGPTTYEHVMAGGPFASQDPRDVVQFAITWWRQYLDEVDRRVAEAASGTGR